MPNVGKIWHRIWIWTAILFLVGAGNESVIAQNMFFTNPSDIQNSQSAFVNPALISYQESQVSLGMKVFHLGFLDDNSMAFKNGFFSASIPYLVRGKVGLGLNGQYFNSPMYTQTNFSLSVSQKFMGIFSVGLRTSLFTKSYDRSMFELIDEDDPVFANGTTKFAFSLGGGLLVTPLPNLYFSFAVDHLNRPNVALSSQKYAQPLELSSGIKYGFGKFCTSFYIKKIDKDLYPFFEIEPDVSDIWKARVAYGMDALRFDGLISLFNGFELGYTYDYPVSSFHVASYGSHMFNLTYFIDRHPGLPTPVKNNDFEIPFRLVENNLELQPRFEVFSSVTSLEIIDKRIYRKIDPQLSDEELSYLVRFEMGALDSSTDGSAQHFSTHQVGTQYPEVKRRGIFTENYQYTLEKINELMESDSSLTTEIITSKGSSNRAAGLKNYLTRQAGLQQEQVAVVLPEDKNISVLDKIQRSTLKLFETLTVVTHDSTVFHIFPIFMDKYERAWKLRIVNSQDKLIKEFSGIGDVPSKIHWDWKKEDMTIIEPQLYYYTFHWIDEKGQSKSSEPRLIDVRKIKRNLTVTVSRKPRKIDKNVKKIGIRLNR